MGGKAPREAQTCCARCGQRFADPQASRGYGHKICEECMDREAEER